MIMPSNYRAANQWWSGWCLLTAFLVGGASAGLRAQGLEACAPTPAVKAALDQLPSYPLPTQTYWQYEEQRLVALRALLKQYPDNAIVWRTFLNTLSDPDDRDKLREEFKARHEKNPDDPLSSYLYGNIMVGRDSTQAIKLFEGALEKAPKFPWPHRSLLVIYNSPNFLNKDQATAHMKAFLNLCPEYLEGYGLLTDFDDKEMLRQAAAKLRALLQPRSDKDALDAYSTLWSLEFKAHSPSEYDPLRKQAGEDLKRLRALNLQDTREWYEALEEGYKLVNDQKQSDWAKDERQSRFPTLWELPSMSKWTKDHKNPGVDAPADKAREYYTELWKQSAEWVKERPNSTSVWWFRENAVEHLEDVPAAEVEATVDKAFEVAKNNAGPRELDSYDYFRVAEILSKRGLQPERIVEMAQKGLARWEIESKRPDYDLYATKENTEDNKFYRASRRVQGLQFEADGYVRLKQAEKVQTLLAQMDERLQDLKPLAGDKQERVRACTGRESAYWGLMGRLAELQNRKLDAMAYYEDALVKRLEAKEKPETGIKDELAENAHTLWKSLGGTDEGWRVWYGRPANELAQQANLTWEEANLPLPSFQLADLHGKTWQVADLKGKVTFLNFWASW
jgi:hypothetical protein